MKCPKCGRENKPKNKYCSSCGEKLDTKIICSSCGKIVQPGSKFCNFCGARIKDKAVFTDKSAQPTAGRVTTHGRVRSKAKSRNSGSRFLGYAILAVMILGIGVFVIWIQASSNKTAVESQTSQAYTEWSPAVLSVAENFKCPCGECTDRLDICTCDLPNGAVEAKTYIRELLDSDLSQLMVIQKVEEQYGHRL